MSETSEKNGKGRESMRSSTTERLVALLGALAVAAVIGFMFWLALWGKDSPPDVEVEFVRTVPSGDDYLLEILVVNHGGSTAAGVKVTGKLMQDGTSAETSEVTIDFVPRQSEVQAGLYFSKKPTRGTLEFSVDGYNRP